jgi:Ca-activated chloride channel homolog
MSNYWPFLLLLLIPFIWRTQRNTRVDLSAKHLRLSGFVRSATVVLLALALTQPVIYRSGELVSVMYLLDISQSVLPADIQSGIQWIQQTNDSGKPDHGRFIPFGANSEAFETLNQIRTVSVGDKPGAIAQSATNIEGAIENAIANFAPHHLKRLVLMTDGNENLGRISGMVSRLKRENVQVYAVPLHARAGRDLWIESIMAPSAVTSEEQFPLEVHVYSQVNAAAHIELRQADKKLGARDVQLESGINRVAFETSIKSDSGPVTIEAEVTATEDTFLDNNKFSTSIVVNGPPHVLYVEGHAQSARYLDAALQKEGITVTTTSVNAVPVNAADFDVYDAVVLSDVARTSLSNQQMKAMATYVRDLGGGFVLAGGENTYGGGDGYSDSDIEKILPITFDAKRPHRSVAMIVVLDKSGSMGGPDFAFTKEAAQAPLEVLADTDSFGVLAFDSSFFWASPFQSAENRREIAQAISTIVPGGETDIYPPLEEAYMQLLNDQSEVKHVILLSDGHTAKDPFQTLAEKMAAANITVSTIALGTGADKDLLANIAKWGKGRAYFLTDAKRVPQVFQDESELATGTTLREGPFTPVVKKEAQMLKGIDFKTAPRLLGYVATKPKEKAQILLESDRKDPVLARWQYGLGKTAAFTSDLKDRWAVDWLRWNGYSKFWSQLVRQTMRAHDDSRLNLRVIRNGGHAQVTIDAIEKDGEFRNKIESQLRVLAPDQSVIEVPVHQVGPGSYEAEVALTQKGSYVFRLIGAEGGASRTLAYSYPDEYHFYPPNIEPLRAISNETNGKFEPTAADVFATRGETTPSPMQLWPYLVVLALLLYIGDVFLRRVRLFEHQ